MRIKTDHLNLGIFHEAYFVCSSENERYFSAVRDVLQREYAVKTGIFVYDKDVFDGGAMRKMRNSYNVLFMLNEGVSEAAAANESHPFRKVYGYVQAKNSHSISLVSVNGCQVSYDIEYPPEMESYMWLHRKNFFIDTVPPEKTAELFYEEFRRNHSKRERNRLRKLSKTGREKYVSMYESLYGGLWRVLIVELVAALAYYLHTLIVSETSEAPDELLPLAMMLLVVSIGLCITTFIWVSILIARTFYVRDRILDVSSVFADFKRTTAKRLAFFSVPAMTAALGWGGFGLLRLIEEKGYTTDAALIAIYGTFIVFTVARFVKTMLLRAQLEGTKYYLEAAAVKLKIGAAFFLVDVFFVAVALMSGAYFGIF